MSNLENQIKQLIIDSLGLEDITVADIGSLVSAGLKIIDGNKPKAS